MIVADLEWFTAKGKIIIYIRAFVKLYNQRNYRQVYKIYKIVELEKWCILTAKNPYNFGAHCIGEIFFILHITHIVPKNHVFYINNYIN